MHERRAGFVYHLRQGAFARLQSWLAEGDLPAVTSHSRFFDRRRILRHDDVSRDPAQSRRQRQRLGVVAGGMRGNAARGFIVRQRKDGVAGPAELESAHLLQVFAFHEDLRADPMVEAGAGQYGGDVGVGPDAFGSLADVGDGGWVHVSFQSIAV